MPGVGRFTETGFVQGLARALANTPRIADELQSADINQAKFVKAMLEEPGLTDAIGLAISDPVAEADRIPGALAALDNEITALDPQADAAVGVQQLALPLLTYTLATVGVAGGAAWLLTGEPPATLVLDWRPWLTIVLIVGGIVAALRLSLARAVERKRVAGEARSAKRKERDDLRARQAALESEIAGILQDKVMLPVALRVLERVTDRSYHLTLPAGSADPLGEVFDPWFQTPTASRLQLAALFGAMNGGSIGISGPRGSGKTTLIDSFCRRSDGTFRPRDRPVLAFATPAPARYEARDFVLHLFAMLCRAVLAAAREQYRPGQGDDGQPPHPVLLYLRRYATPMSIAGQLILMLSTAALALRAAVILYPSPQLQRTAAFLAQISHALGVKLGFCFMLGALLTAAGVGLGRYLRWKFEERERATGGDSLQDRSDIVGDAARNLDTIHFQRSFTVGWSGTLTLPAGLAMTANEARTRAERQASLPELVDQYATFVRRVVGTYTLVIGIDELDKFKSDEEAERFLNDNKILFGLEGCFYLVSISESALARFERRGLPLRDVFDSSFDEVLHVGYLDTAHAIRLLRRRVPSLPVPFACLCHCLSGGLPRDLIRACRSLYLIAEETSVRMLDMLTETIVGRDFQRKCSGIALAARQLDTADVSDFLMVIDRLTQETPRVELFDGETGPFSPFPIKPRETPGDDDRRLAALAMEFASFLLYSATLLSFFGPALDEAAVRQAEAQGLFDDLTKARQCMSIDPKLSWQLCAGFRRRIGLRTPWLRWAASRAA